MPSSHLFLAASVVLLTACESPQTHQVSSGVPPSTVETGAHALLSARSERQCVGWYDAASDRLIPADTTQQEYIVQLEADKDLLIVDDSSGKTMLRDSVHWVEQGNTGWGPHYESNTRCPANPWLGANQRLAYRWDFCRKTMLVWVVPTSLEQTQVPRKSNSAAVCFYLSE